MNMETLYKKSLAEQEERKKLGGFFPPSVIELPLTEMVEEKGQFYVGLDGLYASLGGRKIADSLAGCPSLAYAADALRLFVHDMNICLAFLGGYNDAWKYCYDNFERARWGFPPEETRKQISHRQVTSNMREVVPSKINLGFRL